MGTKEKKNRNRDNSDDGQGARGDNDDENLSVRSYDANDPQNEEADLENPKSEGDEEAEATGSDAGSESSDDVEHERRVQMLHQQIIANDESNFQKMRSQFFTEGEVDGSDGTCCLKYPSAKGVKYILIFDAVFFITILRPTLACMVMSNYNNIGSYAKCRKTTFWLYAFLLFGGILGWIIYDVLYDGGD